MTPIGDLLTPLAIRANLVVPNKKALFHQLAALAAAAYQVDSEAVLDRLLERERLGSTGFGNGIAIPHGKIEGLTKVIGVCVHLAQPIDFDAIDDLPIDVVFMLLSPVDGGAEHLKALATVSRAMRDQKLVAKIRGVASDDAMYALFGHIEHATAR